MEAGAAKNGASTSAKEEISREEERRPSLNSLALMRKATTPDRISSIDINYWRDVVYKGVLLENNTQKFWVDEKLHKNCFLVLPKACDIAGDDEESCWSWITVKENWFSFRSAVDIPVPRSNLLHHFLIQGRFETRALSPNTTYEVAFVVKVNRTDSSGFFAVNLELDLPDGTKQTCKEDMKNKPRGKWIKLRAGEFVMGPDTVGRIIFTLHEGYYVITSNVITLRGVLIHPKDDSAQHNQDDAVEHEFL